MRLIELLKTVQVKRLLLTILLLLSGTQAAIAYTNFCKPDNGTYNYRYEFGMLTVVDPKGNKPGYLFPRPYQWDLGGNFSGTCDCDPEPETEPDHIADNTYFSTATILPQGHTDGSRNFLLSMNILKPQRKSGYRVPARLTSLPHGSTKAMNTHHWVTRRQALTLPDAITRIYPPRNIKHGVPEAKVNYGCTLPNHLLAVSSLKIPRFRMFMRV
ncbi:hypothetical protein [Lelliottia aquatilis]|uniref:hypothetical protein n=1 Tax=Lelliottia aquatilis TaxID=2080838 RepID=UPI0010575AC8|nr:hypothetical protein [Lelliottia aquatilis]